MTEQQLRAVPQFAGLPIYDEHDGRAVSITTVHGAGKYANIRECWSVDDARRLLADPRMVPLGSLRAVPRAGETVFVAYFGELPRARDGG
jgi:hypothetical protein